MSNSEPNSEVILDSIVRKRSNDHQTCNCSKCNNEENQAENKLNPINSKKIHECNKKLNTIVNRLILRTKINSIDFLNSVRRKLPSIKSSPADTFKIRTNHLSYKPFNRVHKINKLSRLVVSTKRFKRPSINCVHFDFSNQTPDSESIQVNNSGNKVKALPWEASTRIRRNRKNRKNCYKNKLAI